MAKKGEVVKDFYCNTCGEKESNKFYGKMKSMCGKCHAADISQRLRNARKAAIDYKGGKCEHCGYNKYVGALEFHHKDPTEKDPTGLKAYKLSRLFAEVDKCILLCSNCHKEEHARLRIGNVAEPG
jgi:5-methylcytosine-specific restriction endonuclease McrA